jgi:hypothetical protein
MYDFFFFEVAAPLAIPYYSAIIFLRHLSTKVSPHYPQNSPQCLVLNEHVQSVKIALKWLQQDINLL